MDKNFMALTDFMTRNKGENDRLTLLAKEYEANLSIGRDLPLVEASDRLFDQGEFKEPWAYNKTSNPTSLDEGARFYKTGKYDRSDLMGMRSSAIGVEYDKYKLMGAKANQWRAEQTYERVQFIALDQEHDIIYGDPTKDPKQFLGLYPRYDVITNTKGIVQGGSHPNTLSPYVTLDAKGTGSKLTSLLVLVPGTDAVCKIYPKDANLTGGIEYSPGDTWDKVYETDVHGNKSVKRIASDIFSSTMGIAVRNRHACVRIANIDLLDDSSTDKFDAFEFALMQAMTVIPMNLKSRAIVYCSADAIPYFKFKYNKKYTAGSYEAGKLQNVNGDFELGGFTFRPVEHMTMAESQLVNA